jgi:hypothetical protein
MDPVQPLRIAVQLGNIHSSVEPSGGPLWPTYLWTVFFKIDGDTVNVGADSFLHGHATVVSTSGDHGDLGPNTEQAGDIPIPKQLGEFRHVLKPIPITPVPGLNTSGTVGCIALLLAQHGTPDEAIAHGHAALNGSVQNQLNSLIPTLGMNKHGPTKDDIDAMTQRISDTINAAIKDDVSIWQWLGSLGNEDFKVGSSLFRFSYDDLVNAPPTGMPLQPAAMLAPYPSVAGVTLNTWQLTGHMFADPFNFSLKRFLAFEGLDPTKGIRGPMTGHSFFHVRDWIKWGSPTFAP